jgi:hypothetical protein
LKGFVFWVKLAIFDLRVDGVPRVFGFASMAFRVDGLVWMRCD